MGKAQRKIATEIGPLYIVASERALRGVFWKDQNIVTETAGSLEAKMLDRIQTQIGEYLAGQRREFDLPIEVEGTEFQKRVWERLTKIPYGQTKSYKDIAGELNDIKACRAVGTANGRNPISLIVPCHRVIASNGTLGGYAGGLTIKEKLLALEKTGSLSRIFVVKLPPFEWRSFGLSGR